MLSDRFGLAAYQIRSGEVQNVKGWVLKMGRKSQDFLNAVLLGAVHVCFSYSLCCPMLKTITQPGHLAIT